MLIRYLPARPRRWLILFALLAALPLPSAAARPSSQLPRCGSPNGDVWFVEEISIAPLQIAPGVTVEPLGPGEPRSDEFLATLSNTTNIPLYVVETHFAHDWDLYAPASPISLENHLIVRQRVVSATVEVWVPIDDPRVGGWRSGHMSSLKLERENATAVLPNYQSFQHDGDDRPPDVAIPQTVTYTLSVIYGRELFAIPVLQSYRLNPSYDPNKRRDAQAPCDSWGKNLIQTPLALLTMVGRLVRWCLGVMMLILATSLLVVLGRAARIHLRGRP
jgi:hypothetical protein